jgi:hypothetical protein
VTNWLMLGADQEPKMAYSLYSNTNGPRRYWYSACPKTGTQSLKAIFDRPEFEHILGVTYVPEDISITAGDLKGSVKWHQPSEDIIHEKSFQYERDQIFATIRNPWERFASFYRYQKEKVEDKIQCYNDGLSYDEYQDACMAKHNENGYSFCEKKLDPDGRFIGRMNALYDTVYCNFDTFIDHVWYCYGKRIYHDDWSIYRMPQSLLTLQLNCQPQSDYYSVVSTGQPVHYLKLEDPNMIIRFIRKHFDYLVEMPHVNVTGNGKDYRDLYTSRTKEMVEILEADIIRIGSYKY